MTGSNKFRLHSLRQAFSYRARLVRCSRGQSLVETSLVFPILLTFLFGGAELARVERAAITVSNAAKAGVQYAVQNGFTAQDTSGISGAASAEATGYTIT